MLRRLDHVGDQHGVQGWQGDGAVASWLNVRAARPKRNEWPKDAVLHHADHQFPAIRFDDHRLDTDAVDRSVGVVLAHFLEDFLVGLLHRRECGQIQAHAARIRLVGDLQGIDFHHHRQADFPGQIDRLDQRTRHHGSRDRNVEGRQ